MVEEIVEEYFAAIFNEPVLSLQIRLWIDDSKSRC